MKQELKQSLYDISVLVSGCRSCCVPKEFSEVTILASSTLDLDIIFAHQLSRRRVDSNWNSNRDTESGLSCFFRLTLCPKIVFLARKE